MRGEERQCAPSAGSLEEKNSDVTKYFLPYFHQQWTTEEEDEQCGGKGGHKTR